MATAAEITKVDDYETVEEFFAAIAPQQHVQGAAGALFIHRGHGSETYRLRPTAFRLGSFKSYFRQGSLLHNPASERRQLEAEFEVLRLFLGAVDHLGLSVPEDSMAFRERFEGYPQKLFYGADSSDMAVWPPRWIQASLALARHSGIPTRLLDWTSNAFSAAWFAASSAAKDLLSDKSIDGDKLSVWSFDRLRFNRLIERGLNIGSFIDGREVVPLEIFSTPYSSNPNASAQKGLFTVVRESAPLDGEVSRAPLDEVIAPFVRSTRPAPVFYQKRLSVTKAPSLLLKLAQYDFITATQFPGYAGAADSVKDWRLYDALHVDNE